jgi:hypothetical protein
MGLVIRFDLVWFGAVLITKTTSPVWRESAENKIYRKDKVERIFILLEGSRISSLRVYKYSFLC